MSKAQSSNSTLFHRRNFKETFETAIQFSSKTFAGNVKTKGFFVTTNLSNPCPGCQELSPLFGCRGEKDDGDRSTSPKRRGREGCILGRRGEGRDKGDLPKPCVAFGVEGCSDGDHKYPEEKTAR